MMQMSAPPGCANPRRCTAPCSASRLFSGVHSLHSCTPPSVPPAAGRALKNTARTGGFQRPLGCRLRSQATALAQSTGQSVDELPEGYAFYETMIVLRPDMNEEERDVELAKFEAFLKAEDAREISALVRGSQHLAYPIKGYWDGIYVLYTYAAQRKTSQRVQKLLSTPVVGSETNVLRHMTFIN